MVGFHFPAYRYQPQHADMALSVCAVVCLSKPARSRGCLDWCRCVWGQAERANSAFGDTLGGLALFLFSRGQAQRVYSICVGLACAHHPSVRAPGCWAAC